MTEKRSLVPDKNGFSYDIVIDRDGHEIFHSEETPNSAWRKAHTYDQQSGRLQETVSQTTLPGKESQSRIQYEYGEDGSVNQTGAIEVGPDAGHQWQETTAERDLGEGRIIKTVTTKILEQGTNATGKRPEKGAEFIKTIFMENGTWLGEKVLHPDGHETTQMPKEVKELPNWE
ncbi:MAG: hypothetical protein PHY34_04710 [Patescibacteria group bacterium]|nr:hypothetical protein [Patescibacteria group bacterium]